MYRATCFACTFIALGLFAFSAHAAPKPIFKSKVVTAATGGVEIDVDIRDAKQLYLVVTDAGDGYGCDWADWAVPRLIGPDGERKLTEIKWKSASTGHGQVQVDRNASGRPLVAEGKKIEYGIGTHANSIIAFDLPPGYTRFEARGVLDEGGTSQGCGSTVAFHVYTQDPGRLFTPDGDVVRDPEQAVANLDIAEGLHVTLAASEPQITNLTNLDIDHRGRVWVCEVMNYRRHNGSRPEGDRILILEDTDGDGVMDKQTVYYQGRDVDSAMGICVLGNRVIVSCSPNVLVFTDENGDDRPDKKEMLFTKTGRPQHDHSAHSFMFGPDGKLYWNFGNTGGAVHDSEGNPVTDLAGNVVRDGDDYKGGMIFRCDLDGGNFETLAHNFRNNYEVAVDSFGTLWQSDNDDDGNRGVRINYVMEYGNYGYLDEMTRAGWSQKRTGWSDEIPLRHWHLNDPGVVPNLLQTGTGSPTGITIYEGTLLPEVFRNQMIHCDAGPSIVRAYPVERDGAGYTAETVNMLDGRRDRWFRPADVCVAPDGSLFVTDWYDPGVGGHNQRDTDSGRLFRVATPQSKKYEVPRFDFDTIDGAIEALGNPNLSVRYLAWTALNERGVEAEPALKKVFDSASDQRLRARALWLLGKIEGRGEHYVQLAAQDKHEDIRIVAIRLARQVLDDVIPVVQKLVGDDSPAVRRECAIALRGSESPERAKVWAELAVRYPAGDRWYLEALGIAADGDWDACLAAWLSRVGDDWNTPTGRDILWRSRAAATPGYLVKIIHDPQVEPDTLPRYLRAFDFLKGEEKDAALVVLAFGTEGDDERTKFVTSEALSRLPKIDLKNNPELAASMNRALDRLAGGAQFVSLVARFELADRYPQVLAIAQQHSSETLGVEAIKLLLARGQGELIKQAIQGEDAEQALATLEVLGVCAGAKAVPLLAPLCQDGECDIARRRAATRAMAFSRDGAKQLVAWANDGKLPPSLMPAAAVPLATTPYGELRADVARLFPLPAAKEGKPLPPLVELLKLKGNAELGKQVYLTTGTCVKCHQIGEEGKQVGPALSDIGGKLSRTALYESILYPSAGISHNYETHVVEMIDGTILSGIVTSETEQDITIKNAEAIEQTIPRERIEHLSKQPVSLMPADLQNQLTAQDLADLVAYLTTLKAE